jgi:hypothetical protein
MMTAARGGDYFFSYLSFPQHVAPLEVETEPQSQTAEAPNEAAADEQPGGQSLSGLPATAL